jgi:transposase
MGDGPEKLPEAIEALQAALLVARAELASASKLGEDITETLEVIPKSWKVIQHVREKFSCRDCEKIS